VVDDSFIAFQTTSQAGCLIEKKCPTQWLTSQMAPLGWACLLLLLLLGTRIQIDIHNYFMLF
jgi:hypothetical protein